MKRILSLAVFCSLLIAAWWWWTHRPLGEADTVSVSTLNVPRHAMPAVAYQGSAWIIGGYSESGRVSSVEVIDPETGRAPLRTTELIPRMYHAAVVHENRIWVLGGTSERTNNAKQFPDAVEAYDPANGTVTTITRLPYAGAARAAAIVSNRLYVVGGTDIDGIPSGRVDIYDIAADSWSRGPDMPTPRQCALAVRGHHLYALGGYNGYAAVYTVEAFDTASGSWSSRPPLPVVQSAHCAWTLPGGSLLLVGDYASGNLVVHGDPDAGDWFVMDVPFTGARHNASVLVGRDVVMAGGRKIDGNGTEFVHVADIRVFSLIRLLRAGAKIVPVPEPLDRQRIAQDVIEQAILRMGRLSSVDISGWWDLSYHAEGRSWSNRTPYRLVVERPARIYYDADPFTAWHDGDIFTFRFTRDGTYQQYEGRLSLDNAVKRGYPWFRPAWPFGHAALIGPDGANYVRSQIAYRPVVFEREGRWRERPTWIVRTQITNEPDRVTSPDVRVHIDQASGVPVVIESLPPLAGRSAWPERDDSSAMIARTLAYRFEVSSLMLDETVDTNQFTFLPRERDRKEIGRQGGTPHPHPRNLVELTQQIGWEDDTGAVLPDLPSDLFEKKWERTPGGASAGSINGRFVVSIAPTHVYRMDQQAIRVLNVEDGSSVMTLPAPAEGSGPLLLAEGVYLPRRQGGGVWATVPPRPPEQFNNRLSEIITAFDESGAVALSIRLPAAKRAPRLHVAPLSPEAGYGLFVFTFDYLALYNDEGAELFRIPITANALIEASDRDRDGRLEMTIHDKNIRRFVFRDDRADLGSDQNEH